MEKTSASLGSVRARPARSEMVSTGLPLAPHRLDAGEHAEIGEDIDGQIDQHAARAQRRARRQAQQRIAHMADGAIGHQALDVLLADRRDRAQRHARAPR